MPQTRSKRTRLFLIDSYGYIFRAYHARARTAAPPMRTTTGLMTEAIFIFHNMIRKLRASYQPEYIAAVFEKGKTFREEAFAGYKANRTEMPPDLGDQIPYRSQGTAIRQHATLVRLLPCGHESRSDGSRFAPAGRSLARRIHKSCRTMASRHAASLVNFKESHASGLRQNHGHGGGGRSIITGGITRSAVTLVHRSEINCKCRSRSARG